MIGERFRDTYQRGTLFIGICLSIGSLIVTSCSTTEADRKTAPTPTSGTPTSSAFPYPPIQYRTDIAVPLTEPESAAALFAMETDSILMQWLGDASKVPDLNARLEYSHRRAANVIEDVPETGGNLYRTVGVKTERDNRWLVTYCRFDSPGVYQMGPTGELVLSTPAEEYRGYRSTVALTTEKSGTGETSTVPRLLVVGAVDVIQDEPTLRQTCDQFKPSPFLRQPPSPTPGK